MGMPFLVDDGVVIELNWDQMAMMSLAQTGIYTTCILSNKEVLYEQVRESIKQLEKLKGENE